MATPESVRYEVTHRTSTGFVRDVDKPWYLRERTASAGTAAGLDQPLVAILPTPTTRLFRWVVRRPERGVGIAVLLAVAYWWIAAIALDAAPTGNAFYVLALWMAWNGAKLTLAAIVAAAILGDRATAG